jgi:hypothetical protein
MLKHVKDILPSIQGRLGLVNIHYKVSCEDTSLKKHKNKAHVLELLGTSFKFTLSATQPVLKQSAYWGTA